MPIPRPAFTAAKGNTTLTTKYTGSSTAANRGWNHSASPKVTQGRRITVNMGPMVWAKKNSTVSISDTAMLSKSPFSRSIRQAGASFRMVPYKCTRMLAKSR